MNAIIVDDELHCIETLKYQLQNFSQVNLIGTFNIAREALNYINTNTVDVLFVDINMPEMNGLDLIKNVNQSNIKIVFTTAYDQYALQAIKLAAFDYLLKPIDDDDLQDCIDRLTKLSQQSTETQLGLLKNILKNPNELPSKIALPTETGLSFVEATSIVRCQSSNNYTYVHFLNDASQLICRSLKDVESVLEPYGFLRVHQSHLINIKYLIQYSKGDGGFVKLQNGDIVPVTKWNKVVVDKFFAKL